MGLLFLIVTGAAFGWLSAVVFKQESPYSLAVNFVAGISGAVLGGVLIGPLIGGANLIGGKYSVDTLLLSAVGAIIALCLIHAMRLDRSHR